MMKGMLGTLLFGLKLLHCATSPSLLPSALFDGVDFSNHLAIVTHLKEVSHNPKQHKSFLKRVLQVAAATNTPALIQAFFQHVTGHYIYAFQSALLTALQNSVELGNKDVVATILGIDTDRFNHQLLLSSDLIELAVQAGLAEDYDMMSTIMDNQSIDNARQVITTLSQTTKYAESSMLQVVLANKTLLLDIASTNFQI